MGLSKFTAVPLLAAAVLQFACVSLSRRHMHPDAQALEVPVEGDDRRIVLDHQGGDVGVRGSSTSASTTSPADRLPWGVKRVWMPTLSRHSLERHE
jgi:hypothetical protein